VVVLLGSQIPKFKQIRLGKLNWNIGIEYYLAYLNHKLLIAPIRSRFWLYSN
jgi:hypothetical protein